MDIAGTVNGVTATGSGNTLSVDTSALSMDMTLDAGTAQGTNLGFNITGGGAVFQIGPTVSTTQQARLGIQSFSTGDLVGVDGRLSDLGSGGTADLATSPTKAAQIVNEVANQVTSLRGRLGAFQQSTLDSNINSLNDAVQNLTSAKSSIQDADFAAASAALTRAQVLVQSGTAVLSIANHIPDNVLGPAEAVERRRVDLALRSAPAFGADRIFLGLTRSHFRHLDIFSTFTSLPRGPWPLTAGRSAPVLPSLPIS